VIGVIVRQVKKLGCIGEGERYLEYSAFPVAIKRSVSNINDTIVFNNVKESDNDTIYNIEPGTEITSIHVESPGLYPAEIFTKSFYQDLTPDNFFDISKPGTPEDGTSIIYKKR